MTKGDGASDLMLMPRDVVFTVVTRNHFHYAAALQSNVHHHNPDVGMVIVVADLKSPEAIGDSSQEVDWNWLHSDHQAWRENYRCWQRGCLILGGDDLCDEPYDRFAFQYSAFELTCALKSQAGCWLLQRGVENLIYLDGDVRLYQSLETLWQELDGDGVLLTPHVRSRLPEDGRYPNNIDLLRTGNFNAGIWAAKQRRGPSENASASLHVLQWWRDCCRRQCIVDPHDGLFVDQKWLDQAVSMDPCVTVSRNRGLNVGYWNLHEYQPESDPLTAYHFSGTRLNDSRLSHYQNRHVAQQHAWLDQALQAYKTGLVQQRHEHYSALPYRYQTLVNGVTIEEAWREVVRTNTGQQRDLIQKPSVEYATPLGIERLNRYAQQIRGGRFQWQQDQLHDRIQSLRAKLDRQPLRKILKIVKGWRRA